MSAAHDAIVVGAGPAGATAAALLARGGWRVALVEKSAFPRRKVCGECLAPANLELLDALGLGDRWPALAGPALERVAFWCGREDWTAPLPARAGRRHAHGRALGRERLDALLVEAACAAGVELLQPWRATALAGHWGDYRLLVRAADGGTRELRAPVLVHAGGSWEPAAWLDPRTSDALAGGDPPRARDAGGAAPHSGAGAHAVAQPTHAPELLAFKANFVDAALEPGLLPVLGFEGGYGGLVLEADARVTLACCVRRDALRAWRAADPGRGAGEVVERRLRRECAALDRVLHGARREGAWLAVGPLQASARPRLPTRVLALGNAAAEAHPIIGEGMSLALRSAWFAAAALLAEPERARGGGAAFVGRWSRAWRRRCRSRLLTAAALAQLAMRPRVVAPVLPLLDRWPGLLGAFARLGGKLDDAPWTPRASDRPPAPLDDAPTWSTEA